MEGKMLQNIIKPIEPPKGAIEVSEKLQKGANYWFIRTNDSTNCVVGYGTLTNTITKIRSAISTKSAFDSQFDKFYVFENKYEKTYVYSPQRIFDTIEELIRSVQGIYKEIYFAASAVNQIQKTEVDIYGILY